MASIGGNSDDPAFQNRDEGCMICPSSGMTTTPFFASAWEPVASLSQHESLGGSSLVSQTNFGNSPYPDVVQNHGFSGSSHLVQYPSDSSFIQLPKLPSFGSGSFSELVGPFGHTDCCIAANTGLPICALNENGEHARKMMNVAQSSDNHQVSEEAAIGASPSGRKRKRGAQCDSPTNFGGGLQKEHSKDSSSVQEEQEKRLRTDQTVGGNFEGKQAAKQAKGNCPVEEPPKYNYIHVRARRGQATNSHSLAERVRREKISERMKTLQELVPGCNKITGKAVMLDEIINYVQSLQQQVEFLSMKLATVNPELNIDIERIFSKDIFHLPDGHGGNSAFPGLNSGMNSLSYSNRMYGASMPPVSGTSLQFPAMSQPTLDTELQSFLHMGFNSNSTIDHLAPNGGLKPDQ